jgi:tyrosinase
MASIEELRSEARTFFSWPVRHTDAALNVSFERPPRFSQFDVVSMDRVAALVSEFVESIRGKEPEDGLASALDIARRATEHDDPELVKWALTLFITHDPVGARLPIPSMEEVDAQLLVPSAPEFEMELAEAELDPETKLNWFREDPWANEHHQHWHAVYPWRGYEGRTKDRAGELFVYMHEQMLARYDTERYALGLPLVEPLADYRAPIPGGYDPGFELRDGEGRPFLPRPPGRSLSEVEGFEQLEQWRDRLSEAVSDGSFDGDDGADRLGDHIEASIDSTWGAGRDDRLHNEGHGFLGKLVEVPTRGIGVITDVRTAIRDPVFYRWHRHIDDFSHLRQQRQGPRDLEGDAPPVVMRSGDGSAVHSPDIILALERQVPESAEPSFDGRGWAESTFGGDRWDTDFSTGDVTTTELQTSSMRREVRLPNDSRIEIEHLVHEPFFLVYRVENTHRNPQPVTVRTFLAASELSENRRLWIEMDKFSPQVPLQPGRNVLFRPASHASVIRRSSMPPEPIEHRGSDLHGDGDTDYCQCGWPYNLLVPRGTPDGMEFRLFVIVTDGSLDARSKDTCGSMSFCGLRDVEYPDARPMGYPFDRPIAERSIALLPTKLRHVAMREIKIRYRPL